MPTLMFEAEVNLTNIMKLKDEITSIKEKMKGTKDKSMLDKLNGDLAITEAKLQNLMRSSAQAGANFEANFVRPYEEATKAMDANIKRVEEIQQRLREIEARKTGIKEEQKQFTYNYQNKQSWQPEAQVEYGKLADEERELKAELKGTTEEIGYQKKALDEMGQVMAKVTPQVDGFTKATQSMKSLLLQGAAFAGIATSLKAFGMQIVNTRRRFQMMEQSMQVMLGSEEKAADLMEKIKGYASQSPLDLSSVTGAAQQMLSFNIEAEKVPTFLKAIGDVSMGSTQKFRGLTLAFSQMSATGRLMGQDLLQMVNAGFNPLTEISRKTGKSIKQLKDEMQKGAISAEMVQEAFISATQAGGKFAGMSETAAKTIEGQFSMLQDAVDSMFNELGESSEGFITDAISGITTLVKHWKEIGEVVMSVVTVYGEYKAVEMVTLALTRARTIANKGLMQSLYGLSDAIAKSTKAQKLFNAAMKANPIVLIGTAIMAVVTAFISYAWNADRAAEADKRLADTIEGINNAENERIGNINASITALKSETATTLQQVEAYDKILEQSPALAKHYKTLHDLRTASQEDIDKILNQEKEENIDVELAKKKEEAIQKAGGMEEIEANRRRKELEENNWFARQVGNFKKWSADSTVGKVLSSVTPMTALAGISNQQDEERRKAADDYDAYQKEEEKRAKQREEAQKLAAYNALSAEEKLAQKRTELANKTAEAKQAAKEQEMAAEKTYQVLLNASPELAKEYQDAINSGDTEKIKNIREKMKMLQLTNPVFNSVIQAEDAAADHARTLNTELQAIQSQVADLEKTGETHTSVLAKARKEFNEAQSNWVKAQTNKGTSQEDYQKALDDFNAKKDAFQKAGGKIGVNNYKAEMDELLRVQNEEQKKQQKESEKAEQERRDKEKEHQFEMTQLVIDAEKDRAKALSMQQELDEQKASHEREKKYRAEREQIQANYDAQIEQARANWDKQEEIRKKKADESAKNLGIESQYKKAYFDEEKWKQSDEGKAAQTLMSAEMAKSAKRQEAEEQQARITTEQNRQKTLLDMQDYYQSYLDIETEFAEKQQDIKLRLAKGEITQEQADLLLKGAKFQRETSLKENNLDEEKIKEDMQGFADIANTLVIDNVEKLQQMIAEYEAKLEAAKTNGASDAEIAKINTALKQLYGNLDKVKKKTPENAVEAWKKYGSTVKKANDEIKNVGKVVGGTMGEIIEDITDVTDATMSMFDSISQLADLEIGKTVEMTETGTEGIEKTSEASARAMQAVEKASVILAIIGAALQILQKMDKLFGGSDDRDEYDKYVNKQKEINKLTMAVYEYERAVREAQLEESRWFSNSTGQSMADNWQLAQEALEAYSKKANEQQAEYIDRQAGRTGGKIMQAIANPLGFVGEKLGEKIGGDVGAAIGKGIGTSLAPGSLEAELTNKAIFGDAEITEYEQRTKRAIENLRIETRAREHGTWLRKGKSQKTEDLQEWISQTYGEEVKLFDESGMINTELAGNILENYGDKLVGETKETLEKLKEEGEAYEEHMKAIQQSISDMYSPLVDNLTDAIWTWLETGEDALATFETSASETFASIGKSMVKTLTNKLIFSQFEEGIFDLGKQYSKGEISESELMEKSMQLTTDTLNNAGTQIEIIEKTAQQFQEKAKEMGYDLLNFEQDEQQATFGGYETMSEQTGTELSGRFSAMYMVQSRMLEIAATDSLAFENIKNITAAINSAVQSRLQQADETQYILAQSLLELQAINANTALQPKVLKNLNEKIDLWNEHILNL